MQVRTLPAAAGWAWFREGLALYRRQAFAFTALVIMYSMALMLIASVPVIGLPLAAVLVPFGTLGITAAGRDAQRNIMPLPALLIDGFKGAQRNGLLRLGVVHAGLVVLLVAVTTFFARDELANWQVVEGQVDPTSIAGNVPWDAIGVATLVYTPILMLTWFAPQLVAWHRYTVGKALFFSLFACWRNRWPFLVLTLALAALIIAVSWVASLVESFRHLAATGIDARPVLQRRGPTQPDLYRAVLEPPSVLTTPRHKRRLGCAREGVACVSGALTGVAWPRQAPATSRPADRN
jgi:hypothetical protein